MSGMGERVDGELLEAIAFAGDALGPLFLEDPKFGEAGQLLEAFAALDAATAASEWPFGDERKIESALELMARGLEDGVTDGLTWEYRRLFVGPQTKAAPPWGSVYTDHDRVAFGASERELRRWMRGRGIARLAAKSDPADHIGLMLSMMAWIAREKPDALGEYLQMHLLTWAFHFLERVGDVAEHPFYKGLAALAHETLAGIQLALALEVVYPRFYK